MMRDTNSATHALSVVTKSTAAQMAIMMVALHLALRLTVPPARQSRIIGPKRRCSSSHASSLGDPLAAAHAASRMKTVVGSPGMNMPSIPSPRKSSASSRKKVRWSLSKREADGVVTMSGVFRVTGRTAIAGSWILDRRSPVWEGGEGINGAGKTLWAQRFPVAQECRQGVAAGVVPALAGPRPRYQALHGRCCAQVVQTEPGPACS